MTELRSILPYFRPYRKGLVLGLACTALANVLQIAAPYLTKLVIDGLSDPDVTAGRIGFLGSLIVVAAAISGVFRYAMRQLMNGISRRVETDLRDDFFRHLLRLDATYYGTVRTGDLMSRATNDTSAVRMAVGPSVMYLVNTAVTFVFALALMIWISPRLTLVAMVPMIGLPVIVLGFGRVIHRRYEEIQEQFSALSTFVQENLTGVRIVRAYTQEGEQARQFDAYNEEYRARNMELVRTAGLFHPVLGLLSGIAMVLVTWVGGTEVMAGRMTLGDFVAFSLYLATMVWPMIALGWVVNLVQRGEASMGRIGELLDTMPRVRSPERPVPLPPTSGARSLAFEHVWFRFPNAPERGWVLQDVSFSVRPGGLLGVVGATGSGKSTLAELIVRSYDPDQGRILLDGIDLRDLELGELRQAIGFVPQETFLFSETVRDNILLGAPDDGRLERAAEVSQFAAAVPDLPKGFDTLLGERGVNLSGGQRQRAAIARALVQDPPVFVLDDALSAVDTQTESRILAGLRDALSRRTRVIISHRLSAVRDAGWILVLEGGRVVEEGTHATLMSAKGRYWDLLWRQEMEEELETAGESSA